MERNVTVQVEAVGGSKLECLWVSVVSVVPRPEYVTRQTIEEFRARRGGARDGGTCGVGVLSL